MLLAGWTDYAYPESIYAARQAGVDPIWPRLERQTADGRWEPVMEIGIPAGLPRVMTVPLPAGLDAATPLLLLGGITLGSAAVLPFAAAAAIRINLR